MMPSCLVKKKNTLKQANLNEKRMLVPRSFLFLILKFTDLLIPFLFLALKEQYTYISVMAQTLLECGKKKTNKKKLSIVHNS